MKYFVIKWSYHFNLKDFPPCVGIVGNWESVCCFRNACINN